jgi:hypothetical protein
MLAYHVFGFWATAQLSQAFSDKFQWQGSGSFFLKKEKKGETKIKIWLN